MIRAAYERQLAAAQQVLENSEDDWANFDAYVKFDEAYKQMHQALLEVIADIDYTKTTNNTTRLNIYNLNGYHTNETSVDELPRGIYIINGKKVIKK